MKISGRQILEQNTPHKTLISSEPFLPSLCSTLGFFFSNNHENQWMNLPAKSCFFNKHKWNGWYLCLGEKKFSRWTLEKKTRDEIYLKKMMLFSFGFLGFSEGLPGWNLWLGEKNLIDEFLRKKERWSLKKRMLFSFRFLGFFFLRLTS